VKAENLTLEELIRFSEGLVDLHGRRLVIQDLRSLAQFRRDLIEMVGEEQTRRILTRQGFFWGQADAAAMTRIFEWENVLEWLRAGPVLYTLQGMAKAEWNVLDLDEASGRLRIECTCHDCSEADEHIAELGTADQPSCWVLVGYASGYASYCLGKSVYFVEEQCRACGDPFCSALGKDADSWGPEIEPHLPYFHADDILGKIQTLTRQLREREEELAQQRKQPSVPPGVTIGAVEVRSRAFMRVLELAEKVARFDSSLLVTGETGVGKEVLARHIHAKSPRADGPFVAVNCAALPETLLEAELFGHKAGSFTGATRDRVGLFEEANGGTVLLDEIGDVSAAVQLKLLRVLQEKEVVRVGETKPREVDVRVIAATNRNLERAVADNAFREDLFYRLRVFDIEVPPLRERKEDILPLARYFVKLLAGKLGIPDLRLDAICLDYLLEYPWPCNVRELENAMEHAGVLCTEGVILPDDLPPPIAGLRDRLQKVNETASQSLVEVELQHIQRILRQTGGNRARAAEILGIGPSTLYRRLKELRQRRGREPSP